MPLTTTEAAKAITNNMRMQTGMSVLNSNQAFGGVHTASSIIREQTMREMRDNRDSVLSREREVDEYQRHALSASYN